MYNLAYSHVLKTVNVNKILGEYMNTRDIPVFQLEQILETEKLRMLRKTYILTGCDITSKIESKSATLRPCPEDYLYEFGEKFQSSLPDGRKIPSKSNRT